jgi:hypothetical protein
MDLHAGSITCAKANAQCIEDKVFVSESDCSELIL